MRAAPDLVHRSGRSLGRTVGTTPRQCVPTTPHGSPYGWRSLDRRAWSRPSVSLRYGSLTGPTGLTVAVRFLKWFNPRHGPEGLSMLNLRMFFRCLRATVGHKFGTPLGYKLCCVTSGGHYTHTHTHTHTSGIFPQQLRNQKTTLSPFQE